MQLHFTIATKNDSFLVFGGQIAFYENINCAFDCDTTHQDMLLVMEYKNDRWYNLGTIDQMKKKRFDNQIFNNRL